MPPQILVFAGSIRTGAYSGKTAAAAARELTTLGAAVTHITLADYPLPLMDQDLEAQYGVPDPAVKLANMIAAHDGVLIATPEYNSSIPPLLKNTIDWISRVSRDAEGRPMRAFRGKIVGLCSSSNGQYAGIRAINHLRAVLVHCQAEVISTQCSVPRGPEAFDGTGAFQDDALRKSMTRVCQSLIDHVRMDKPQA